MLLPTATPYKEDPENFSSGRALSSRPATRRSSPSSGICCATRASSTGRSSGSCNGFIGAFVAGLTLGNTARAVCTPAYEFGEAEGQLLGLIVFLIVGGVMVPAALPHWDGRAWLYALASLSVVRMAPVALSLARSGLRPATLAFIGWFGPRGLASILYARIVVGEGLAVSTLLESVVTLTVLLSTFLHGATAYPLARRYGDRVGATREGAEEERPVSELPVRIRHTADSRSGGSHRPGGDSSADGP